MSDWLTFTKDDSLVSEGWGVPSAIAAAFGAIAVSRDRAAAAEKK